MKPILFSTPMVQAILAGRKTQTRRVVKEQPPFYCIEVRPPGQDYFNPENKWVKTDYFQYVEGALQCPVVQNFKCPYGQLGDILWIREQHYRYGHWVKQGLTKTGKQKWKFTADKHFSEVRYFDNPPDKIEKNSYRRDGWYKRLARFMPREYCRIWLKITDVRVERLQDISEEDAKAEGVRSFIYDGCGVYEDYNHGEGTWQMTARSSFATLWESINGQESWESNPWIWSINFERTSKPE